MAHSISAEGEVRADHDRPLSVRDSSFLAAGRISPGWSTVLVSFLALMFGPAALLTMTFGVLAAGLEAATGWTHSAVAYGSTLMSLAILVTSPIQGVLTDRFGGRRVVLASLPLFGLALICLRFSTGSITTFYLVCTCAAAAGLGLWPGPFMKVVSGWFDRRMGLAFGVLTSGLGLSGVVVPLLFGHSFRTIGWSNTYGLAGLVVIVIVWPIAFRWLRESRDRGDAAAAALPGGFGAVARSRLFWLTLLLFFALGSINACVLVHGIAILKAEGLTLPEALRVQATVGLGAIIGRLGTGWLLDRLQVRTTGALMFAVSAGYFLILTGGMAQPLGFVAALCGGLVVGAEFNVLGVLIRRHLGGAVFGRVYGLAFAAFHLGGALGSGGLALMLARTGSFGPGLTALLVASLVFAALFLLIGPDPARQGERA